MTRELRQLRQIAGRLQAVVRQRTRLVNQLHQLLARTYPELAVQVKDITAGWVLERLTRYPTATALARATEADLQAIPYLPHDRVPNLLARARDSVAGLDGALIEELVRDQRRQVRDTSARQNRLENLLVSAYHALPDKSHLDTITGFGDVTAAVLTAFVLDVNRFPTAGHLVKYFGVLPIEASSGVTREGTPRGPKRYVMSPRGNDLVRRYPWMAARSAARHNPAGRALYARVRAKHPDRPAIAIGHVMRKLLHLAFAIGKTGNPFDPNHYPWHAPAPVESGEIAAAGDPPGGQVQAAGPRPAGPAKQEVTATGTPTVPPGAGPVDGPVWVDFAHVRAQVPMTRVLDQLGLGARVRGAGAQRRGACPIHRGDGRGRTFSVNVALNKDQCFDARCQSQGDVIDLWAAVHRLSLREAALDRVRTFGLEPAPGSEKRNG
ncbi:MAG: Transposase [Gemmataceae bacterium]|nr:Transposase [Gemmataceae bacterium]